jgi:peptide/nickel transport system substrate-binding protein
MTHFIYPEIPGFEQAGGLAGPQVDYNQYPAGNMQVAAKYMKLAGYPSGSYTGSKTLEVVGATGSPEAEDAEIVNQTLRNLGFKTRFNLVDKSVMYEKFCSVPAEEIDVCPNVGWAADFGDPQAALEVPFNGEHIEASGNSNYGQVDVPLINSAMKAAENVVDAKARANAWAKIDDELVAQAVAIPYDWEKSPNIESSNVAGVGDLWNAGQWDYTYTSLR